MKISIIIPVLNEEKNISKCIAHLIANSNNNKEIIVVDGGSKDNTISEVKKHPEVIIEHAAKGRAIQMNVGARIATGEILYFLVKNVETLPDFIKLKRKANFMGEGGGSSNIFPPGT